MTEEKANEIIVCLPKEVVQVISETSNTPFHVAASIAYNTPGIPVSARRGEAETSDSLLQVIPYVVVVQNNKILTYKRGTEGGEDRLHGKYSIGVGGHINIVDCVSASVAGCMSGDNGQSLPHIQCIVRELNEELNLGQSGGSSEIPSLHLLCWFYDDSNDVSKVHICACFVAEFPPSVTIAAKEDSIKQLEWHTIDELVDSPIAERLETWSAISAGIVGMWMHDATAEKMFTETIVDQQATNEPSLIITP